MPDQAQDFSALAISDHAKRRYIERIWRAVPTPLLLTSAETLIRRGLSRAHEIEPLRRKAGNRAFDCDGWVAFAFNDRITTIVHKQQWRSVRNLIAARRMKPPKKGKRI